MQNADRLQILLVEDEPATRDALTSLINRTSGFEVKGAASGFSEGLALLATPFDLLLVDLDLHDGCGIDLIRVSRRDRPEAKILVISVLGDERTVVAALEAGADGYLLKDASVQTLETQLRSVMAGDAPISPGVARHLLKRFRQDKPALRAAETGGDGLTTRELQMLECLAQGLSYKDVARQFDLSVHTVGEYVKGLYRKLHVHSRGEAVSVAIRQQLIQLEDP
ncbi:MAG: response regulator transcription factor [Pseudomonadota bacterium]